MYTVQYIRAFIRVVRIKVLKNMCWFEPAFGASPSSKPVLAMVPNCWLVVVPR